MPDRTSTHRFLQVDVFGDGPFSGNPVAVVFDAAADLATDTLQTVANWLNLSETTFLLPPTSSEADYRLRIFTPSQELPFAGHPTLGSCHAWLESGGVPRSAERIVQECDAGLVQIARTPHGLAFAAPPLIRSGPVDNALLVRIAEMLQLDPGEIVDSQWVDNGPGWVAVMLPDAEAVLAIQPGPVELDIGVVGAHPAGSEVAFEVRAFFPGPGAGTTIEDPVTGSLNASLAMWLIESGRATPPYTAGQGTVLGRRGRVHISTDAGGAVWVAGSTSTRIAGELTV